MRLVALTAFAILVAACNHRQDVQCEQNADCDLSGGGACVAGITGDTWCAYPDPACPSGMRYSDQDVGDGLAGQCVAGSGAVDAGVDAPGKQDGMVDAPPVVPGSWAKQIPGAGFESVNSVAVAPDGSVFVGGAFDGTLDLGGGPMTATGTQDLFIAKFTASGDHVWSVHFGGTGTSTAGATEIAVLSNGELAIAGNYTGTLKFGTTTLTSAGGNDVFVARLDTSGGAVWSATGGTSGTDVLHDMAVDGSDNIAVCGGINTGGGVPPTGSFFGVSLTGSNDAWLVTLNGQGTHTWGKEMAAGGLDDNCGVAMASNGDVIFVGNYNGTVNAGGSTFTSTSGSLDMYFVRYKGSDGTHIWSASEGGAGNDEALDVDTNGTAMVVTGGFTNSISFGGSSTLTSAGGEDAFVAQFDASNGGYLWATSMGGTSQDDGLYISTRSDGQVTVAGQFAGSANFGGTMITSNGDVDPFVVDLDGSSGAVLQVKSVGGPSRDEAHAVASTTDSLVFGGSFSTSISILNQTYTSMGGLDGYVVRYKR